MSGQSVPLHDHGRAEALQDVLLILSEKCTDITTVLRRWVRRQRTFAFPAGMGSVDCLLTFPTSAFLSVIYVTPTRWHS